MLYTFYYVVGIGIRLSKCTRSCCQAGSENTGAWQPLCTMYIQIGESRYLQHNRGTLGFEFELSLSPCSRHVQFIIKTCGWGTDCQPQKTIVGKFLIEKSSKIGLV